MPDWTILVIFGMILIMLGFFLVAAGMMRSAKESEGLEDSAFKETGEERVKGGGVILIGPVPVVFGTDKRYALLLMVMAVVLMLLSIIFLK
ncbi:MAG: TIGR00304 family protein [Candidatus Methanoperedens sp.]|nr:TIGR00304 family protein [Candidatus Methanoperedens sp.]